MPKVGMEEIRKTQLIEATIAMIHEEGFTNASISKISKRAGLSSGIVAHYFDDKSGLLTATLQYLMRKLGEETKKQLENANTPIERLLAVVNSNFSDEQFKPGVVLDVDTCQEIMDRFDAAMPRARQLLKNGRRRAA